jgi:hypothetical protein
MNASDWLTLVGMLSSTIVILISTVWGFSIWLSKKFDNNKEFFEEKLDKIETNIIKKLEYHERHDDERFADIKNDVWDIRVRNAARDGSINPVRSKNQ